MNIFEYNELMPFVKDTLLAMPKAGHGYNKHLARSLGISTAFLSQILSGKRQFSMEQASLLAEALGLTDLETDYLLTLAQMERAGNQALRTHLQKQKQRIREAARMISNQFSKTKEVADEDKPLYYSDWIYIAIQQLTAIPEFQTESAIAERLKVPLKKIKEVIDFLLKTGLCLKKDGRLGIGPSRIHLAPDSPWIKQHHSHWRARAIERLHWQNPEDLHYSAPMTLSKKDFDKVRGILVSALAEVGQVVDPSPSEELVCLNLDWFRI